MKRSRDDVFSSSQLKQPNHSSRAEPPGQAQASTASSAQKLTPTDALTYLKAVKEIFQDNKDKYGQFLQVMKDFKAQRLDTTGVISSVKELFRGHRNLILGFNTFLPSGHKITLRPEDEPLMKKKPVKFEEAISFVNRIKTTFHGKDHVYKAFLDILNKYRTENKLITEVYQEVSDLFQDHADLLVEFTHFLPDASGAASIHYAQPGRNRNAFEYVEKKPAVSYAARNNHHDSEWNCAEKEKGKGEDRDKKGWEDADSSYRKSKIARREYYMTDQIHQGMVNPKAAICEKVKERLQNVVTYEQFLDCIRSYESKFVTTPEFRKIVAKVLEAHPDLTDECEHLITYIEKTGCMRNSKQISRSLNVEDRDGDQHDRENKYKNKYHERERDRHDRGLAINTKMSSYASKEKYLMKPIQELDLSNCETCTPSYRLLPENYPIPSASRRTEIGDEVLNDHWVSVTSGSEDYSFKHMRKNQYEESLFRCEDDRFELDMLLESVKATSLRVEELLDFMDARGNNIDSTIRIEDHLTVNNLRCIERIYGDHGLDMMDVLRKNTPLTLPVILTRLKKKEEDWTKCRDDFNKVWSEVYAKNYHKSLDHRSFYFKQQDTKNLNAKVSMAVPFSTNIDFSDSALLADIKETSENNQNEDEMLLSIATGKRQPIKPDMEFEYPDPEIQEDLYQLVKICSEQVCTHEQRYTVMNSWTSFVETVFGIPSRRDQSLEAEDSKAHKQKRAMIADADADADTDDSEIRASFSQSIAMETNSDAGKQTGSLQHGTADAIGGTIANDQYASDLRTGLEGFSYDYKSEAVPSGELLVSVTTKPAPSTTATQPETIKPQQTHEETEAGTNIEHTEGNLSCGENLGIVSTKSLESPRKSADESTRGDEMCVDEVEGETKVNADDEVCIQGSSENASENCGVSASGEEASENCDVSASELADAEEPKEGGPHNKVGSEGDADYDNQNGAIPFPFHSLLNSKPLRVEIPVMLHDEEKNSQIFYGNDSFYLVFRFHQILYERMRSAKIHSTSPENKWTLLNDATPTEAYARFKEALHSLLNGSSDNAKFEDECRAIIGAQSYILFTLDKLINKLVKQLQAIPTEEVDNKLLQLYAYERSRNPEYFVDAMYHVNARVVLPEDKLYRIEYLRDPRRLTIQLLADEPESNAVSMDPKFAAYLFEELLSDVPQREGNHGVFLRRNKRKLSTGDEDLDLYKVTEGLLISNDLHIKVNCNTLKFSYVLDTEDFMYRPKSARKALYGTGSSSGASNGASSNGCSRKRKRKFMSS